MERSVTHELLLGLAGRVADGTLARARDRLAAGATIDVDELLAAAAPLSTRDWEFAPAIPVTGEPAPVVLDLSAAGDELDAADTAAAAGAAGQPGTVALWRAWRAPDDLNPGIGRIHLLCTTVAPERLPAITGAMHAVLRSAGAEQPQVEVFRPGTELPSYHRKARGHSALLWAAEPAQPVRIAPDFDTVDPVRGPAFAADHPRLPPEEVTRVLTFLAAGETLLATTSREPDVHDRALGEVVPQSFRSDGEWIWTDTVTYYLEKYRLAPDARLLAHIREREYRAAAMDDVSRHRAYAELFRPQPLT